MNLYILVKITLIRLLSDGEVDFSLRKIPVWFAVRKRVYLQQKNGTEGECTLCV